MDYREKRKLLIDWTKKQITGGPLLDDQLIGESPLNRFFTGFLFPIVEGDDSYDDAFDDDELFNNLDSPNAKPTQKSKRYTPPSSVGFSFFISGDAPKLRVYCDAVKYAEKGNGRDTTGWVKKNEEQVWTREQLTGGDGEEVEFTPDSSNEVEIFNGNAKVDALWRPFQGGSIVTLSMSNIKHIEESTDGRTFNIDKNRETLFEVEFKCIVDSGQIGEYPSKDKSLLTDEEKEIELRYKDEKIYAVGHGAAVEWHKKLKGIELWVDFFPAVEVPQVTTDTAGTDSKVLEFSFLKASNEKEEVLTELVNFVDQYESWIDVQKNKAEFEEEEDKPTANEIVKKMQCAKERMRTGIELLRTNQIAKRSFAIINEAMLMQMSASDKAKGINKSNDEYRWRPFQLAFVLMLLESTINEDSVYRETLDLIWFPTGGGKTEAYLGLMAFLFIYRRQHYSSSYGGTVAIMRYTLRLLTSQQFLRASKVISALELIRRKQETLLGKEAITVGLWVGGARSPNSYKQALELVEDKQFSKLVLTACPWCNQEFKQNNYIAREDNFHFTCTNNACEFGEESNNVLPYNVVDEALYERPPTLLIATVDKFARLAWEERAGRFFGIHGNRPPELIIQDELHLISSALGSIVGVYELAIDTALRFRGMSVKYIASTATIKNADKQVQKLFAREMAIFPPSGLRIDDSYFAKTVPLSVKAGRMYIGYLAPLLNRSKCLEPLAAALLAASTELFKDDDEYLDAWWTHLIYHGTLKAVGNTRTLYQGGIKEYLSKYTFENITKDIDSISPDYSKTYGIKTFENLASITDPTLRSRVDKYLPLRDLKVSTITGLQSAEENAQVFESLASSKEKDDAIDIALATNMVSVGLDVPRLALMIINGQPSTTAEYIQASSRVGRANVPGAVFINYYKTDARCLSHYENFKSFHGSFYRYVEPSSLTPFTPQARKRALHAALVIAIRHSNFGLLSNESAMQFNPEDEQTRKLIKLFKIRCKEAIGSAPTDGINIQLSVNHHIDRLVQEWAEEVKYCNANKLRMAYFSKDKSYINLLRNFGENNGLWETLNSMRNVENSAVLKTSLEVYLNAEK